MVDAERCMKSELELSLNQQSRCAASGWLEAMTCVRQHVIGDSKTYLPRSELCKPSRVILSK